MGACFGAKPTLDASTTENLDNVALYKPLFSLKKNLLKSLNMDDEHFYAVFCTYRFLTSTRRDMEFRENIRLMRKKQLNKEDDADLCLGFANILDPNACIKANQEAMSKVKAYGMQQKGIQKGLPPGDNEPYSALPDTEHNVLNNEEEGIYDEDIEILPCDEIYSKDKNVLVATWIDDIGYPQNDWDDKILFYNNESILNRENILEHFKRDNKK
jgi:hypothetical protein